MAVASDGARLPGPRWFGRSGPRWQDVDDRLGKAYGQTGDTAVPQDTPENVSIVIQTLSSRIRLGHGSMNTLAIPTGG
eukprot:1281483-Prymnesium_polylepis.2